MLGCLELAGIEASRRTWFAPWLRYSGDNSKMAPGGIACLDMEKVVVLSGLSGGASKRRIGPTVGGILLCPSD